jgi:phosphoenolpyruvate carboxylase
MKRLASTSTATYRALLEGEDFVTFFRQATPLDVIERSKIGSRPSRRQGAATLDDLRAIPWVFSWNQARILLPSWYGAGSGVARFCEQHPQGRDKALARLRTMYRRWPYFRVVIDNLEQVLAKTDLHIGARYAELASGVPCASDVFLRIEKEFQRTLRAVRDISGNRVLLARDPALRDALDLRTPYLDTLSYLQVELLERKQGGLDAKGGGDGKRGRGAGSERDDAERIERAIHLTIGGIAAGLRNTG